MMTRPTTNPAIVLSAVLFGLGHWLTELAGNSIYFASRVYFLGWHNKAFRDFELDLFINTLLIFCATLIVLLGLAFARPVGVPDRRHSLVFSAAIGVLSSALGWLIWGIATIASVEIPGMVRLGLYFAMAVVAAFAIVRFRWGGREGLRRGFAVIAETPETIAKRDDPGLMPKHLSDEAN